MNAKQWDKINKGRVNLSSAYAQSLADCIRSAGGRVPINYAQDYAGGEIIIGDVQGIFEFKRADGHDIDAIFSVTLHDDGQVYARVILDDHLEPVALDETVNAVTGETIKQAVWNVINGARRRCWPTHPKYWPAPLETLEEPRAFFSPWNDDAGLEQWEREGYEEA